MKLGLVLSGGGAKGIYEIGVFNALEELGLIGSITAMSGSSIGAINALLLAGGNRESREAFWQEIRYDDLLRHDDRPGSDVSETVSVGNIGGYADKLRMHIPEISSLKQFLSLTDLLPFSQDRARALLSSRVDFSLLPESPDIWFCAYNLEREEPEYFLINHLPQEEILTLAMASSAIPLVFPPVEYKGNHYCDGGIAPPQAGKRNADNLPVAPLAHSGCDLIAVIYLSRNDKVDRTKLPQQLTLLELFPGSPLEAIKGVGTVNLTRDTLAVNRIMGYHDCLAALAPLLLELERGGDGSGALAAHEQYNDSLRVDSVPLLQRAEVAVKNKLSTASIRLPWQH